ncbi:hypothetical protein GCM10009678_31440 [Actinomadura kijaniata]|uniref:Uncharacterized protein n=1 Tax=Actinomadura namibiensis TaxID=182080 RepID=A0A7W3LIK0_ACTNM|nr:hypothetical protein [Actinomadura namibiensis]MBA8948714.1 hypothetical protein [Actinomadura namibiensis]
MRVELSANVFTDGNFELLTRLIGYFIEARHDWIADDNETLVVMDGYFRRHAPVRAQVWSSLVRKEPTRQVWSAGRPEPPTVRVTHESLPEHVEDLSATARVVLENKGGDGDFLLAVAHVFRAERIIEAKERRWLKFVQGGGSGEVPKVVRDECADFRRVKRVVFLLDSDRWTPGEPSKHEKAVAELRAEGVHGHILRFREIENYVPNCILAAVAVPRQQRREFDERLKSLRGLVPEQRAHFDMKKGFHDSRTQAARVPDEQRQLYGSLRQTTVVALRKGFGDGLTALLLREAKAGRLKEEDFGDLGPGVCDELREILALIERIV